jgi:hypothetical protein
MTADGVAERQRNSARRPRLPRLALPPDPPRWWPRFPPRLHGEALTARIGRILAITFTICFFTGLISHVEQHPFSWLDSPAVPLWGYRLTQGLHVITGLVTIPLLLIKLWSVYPLFWEWPPAPTLIRGIERLTLGVLVASTLFELTTGFINILGWYPWHFGFVQTHFWVAWVVAGSILLHVAVKLPAIRRGLATPLDGPDDEDGPRD